MKAHLRILILRKLLISSLQLHRDLVPVFGASVLDDRLHDAARVVLEHDVFHFPADDAHETGDVRAAVCFAEVLLAREGPGVFGLGEEGGVGFGGEALGEEGFLVFVGLAGGCGCVMGLVWREGGWGN